jgi:hypothetical protein
MTEKKKYEKPSQRVIELQHRTMLLAGSDKVAPNSASIEDYENGEFEW